MLTWVRRLRMNGLPEHNQRLGEKALAAVPGVETGAIGNLPSIAETSGRGALFRRL
ncbi:MAG: hypothetical protein WAO35_09820 [Terriglobia bacterium]